MTYKELFDILGKSFMGIVFVVLIPIIAPGWVFYKLIESINED